MVLNNCNLAVLPATVGRLSNIRELHVAGNRLAQLPRELGQLRRLQLLQADDNLLTSLPGAAGSCSNRCCRSMLCIEDTGAKRLTPPF